MTKYRVVTLHGKRAHLALGFDVYAERTREPTAEESRRIHDLLMEYRWPRDPDDCDEAGPDDLVAWFT